MKDPTDTKTADLPLPKKRGRPSTGAARTAAQRKQAQRERDRAAVLYPDEANSVTVTGLVEAIGRYAGRGNADLVEVLARDLVARIRAAQADKP